MVFDVHCPCERRSLVSTHRKYVGQSIAPNAGKCTKCGFSIFGLVANDNINVFIVPVK